MEGLFIPPAVKVSLLESCPADAYKCQSPGRLSGSASRLLTFVRLPSTRPRLRARPSEGVKWLVERGVCGCCNVNRAAMCFSRLCFQREAWG